MNQLWKPLAAVALLALVALFVWRLLPGRPTPADDLTNATIQRLEGEVDSLRRVVQAGMHQTGHHQLAQVIHRQVQAARGVLQQGAGHAGFACARTAGQHPDRAAHRLAPSCTCSGTAPPTPR